MLFFSGVLSLVTDDGSAEVIELNREVGWEIVGERDLFSSLVSVEFEPFDRFAAGVECIK